MEVDEQPAEAQRVDSLWFSDGSLVLRAENALFRVYRDLLARASPVFADMLQFPQPVGEETIEGCPVVTLHDKAAEVTVFLKALLDTDFFMPYPADTTFVIIAGVLRLSHKYDVGFLRRRALSHLSSVYYTKLPDPESRTPTSFDIFEADIAIVIGLAREVGALWMLPYAFYSASCIQDVRVILKCGKKLGTEDQYRLLNGYIAQRDSTMLHILGFLYSPPRIVGCTGSDCTLVRLDAIEFHAQEVVSDDSAMPLSIWRTYDWENLETLCATCLASLKQSHQAARESFWDGLPKKYDLPAWAELEKLKAEAGLPI
ncbi:hypothetical protein C8J57DRAFT_1275423 [Mycena rebaudengoi]|nr:hypothetical protein C8J57DRAFT_1275423 [Mycena rebaudengoi]